MADGGNYRIMRWPQGTSHGSIIVGGNGDGQHANQISSPKGLSFDHLGNLYVVDNNNNRVQKFSIDHS